MQTLQQLRKRMNSAGALRSIISSQKAVSAAALSGYERASASITSSVEVIEQALQVVVMPSESTIQTPDDKTTTSIKIIIGSDLGLVGRFNRSLASLFISERKLHDRVIALGRNMAASLVSQGIALDHEIAMPGSPQGIAEATAEIFETVGTITPTTRLEVFFNKRSGALWEHSKRLVAPITEEYLASLYTRKWPTKSTPGFSQNAPREEMIYQLIIELAVANVSLALSHSLAAEQMARLVTTQNAEKNIDEKIESMTLEYQQRRQAEITEELIDVLNGAAAANSA